MRPWRPLRGRLAGAWALARVVRGGTCPPSRRRRLPSGSLPLHIESATLRLSGQDGGTCRCGVGVPVGADETAAPRGVGGGGISESYRRSCGTSSSRSRLAVQNCAPRNCGFSHSSGPIRRRFGWREVPSRAGITRRVLLRAAHAAEVVLRLLAMTSRAGATLVPPCWAPIPRLAERCAPVSPHLSHAARARVAAQPEPRTGAAAAASGGAPGRAGSSRCCGPGDLSATLRSEPAGGSGSTAPSPAVFASDLRWPRLAWQHVWPRRAARRCCACR